LVKEFENGRFYVILHFESADIPDGVEDA